ncbi:MAG: asparagine synthase (glutamine-hydrolyzing) [Candidatus Xenobiia bacterium LiM19]
MCGIAGIAHWGSVPDAHVRMEKMVITIAHRGPDEQKVWSSSDCTFGHTRLSIIDLEGGRQPMSNEDGTITLVYNGEIYNHRELKKELVAMGHRFSTDHSDTEVIIHSYESWGPSCVERFNGMFAFAIWDSNTLSLFLARDRYGIKPLYVAYLDRHTVIFASELRAIHASGLVEKREDMTGIIKYLSFQNLWDGITLFKDITLFPPGSWERSTREKRERNRFWDYTFPRSKRLSLGDAAEAHRAILQRVIERQTDADVPVVTYLSGGIDSTAVSAAAFHTDRVVRAYTCIFNLDGVGDDRGSDEREFARMVASHLSIEQKELELPQDALKSSLDRTINALEYPRMGMSYENFLIAERVARDARVVLSGMGGDEIHGGYLYRYQAVASQNVSLRSKLASIFRREKRRDPRDIFRAMLNVPVPEERLPDVLTPDFYREAKGFSPKDAITAHFKRCPSRNIWDLVMFIDATHYLHGLLVLEDKLSMAHSLETRVPLLDNELVDFILDLPWEQLCDGAIGKIVFRESVKPWVPDEIYRKPKMGFGPPDASWYRGALKDYIERELSPARVKARGLFQPSFVRNVLDGHWSGVTNNAYMIWSLLSLESWFRVTGLCGGNLDHLV